MSSLIDCPSCRRQLRVPEEFVGKSVRCPSCGETFPAVEAPPGPAAAPSPITSVPLDLELGDKPPAPPSAPEAPRREESPPRRRRDADDSDDDREERRPRRRRRRDFEPCPRCGEDVRRGAVACPFCGLDLEVQGDGYTRQAPVRHDAEPHRGGVIQAMGIASLVLAIFYFLFPISLPLGIAAWVMGRRDLRKMERGLMDPGGRKKTRDGWLCGLIGAIMSVVFGGFATFFIALTFLSATRPQPAAPPPVVNGPMFQNPQPFPPGMDNFTLRGPVGPITLERGKSTVVTLTVERIGDFRGRVVVTVEKDPNGGILIVKPSEVALDGWQQNAVFVIEADVTAPVGERTVHVVAIADARAVHQEVRLDIRVKVVEAR
jgi:predicted Zn finger-like uncharacterized protein